MAGGGKGHAEGGANRGEEAVRDLDERAAAVAELGVGPGGAAVVEVDEDLQALLQDVMRLAVPHVGDEADAAGIVLLGRVVEPLRARQEGIGHAQGVGAVGCARRKREGGPSLAIHLALPLAAACLRPVSI